MLDNPIEYDTENVKHMVWKKEYLSGLTIGKMSLI